MVTASVSMPRQRVTVRMVCFFHDSCLTLCLHFLVLGVKVCTHGSGPLFQGHARNSPGTLASQDDDHDDHDDHDDLEEDKDDGASPVVQDKTDYSKREAQLASDTKALGVLCICWTCYVAPFICNRYGLFRQIKFHVLYLAGWVT